MERGEEAVGLKVAIYKHPDQISEGHLTAIKAEEEDLVTVCLWATSNPHYYKKYQIWGYHFFIILSIIAKLLLITAILLTQEKVECEAYFAHDPASIYIKSLAIIFIVVKMCSTLHQKQVLLYSEEYHLANEIDVIEHRTIGKYINFPFGMYIFGQILTMIYMIWLSVSISLAFEEPLEVFEKFAALFIFSNTEWVIGIIVQLVWPPETEDGEELENYLEF